MFAKDIMKNESSRLDAFIIVSFKFKKLAHVIA